MKRILFACFLLTATLTVTTVKHASAQAVTATSFTTQVNLMDSYIAAGNITMANTTFETLNGMMKSVLAVTKTSIHDATTPAAEASYKAIISNQVAIYQLIWRMKPDLATNRVAIHNKLMEFDATIY